MQRAIRVVAILLVVGFLFALIMYNTMNPPKPETLVWNQGMTLGNAEEAEHFFYDYTDIMCPYCDKFALAMDEHLEDFKKEYVEDEKVFYELRLTALLAGFHPGEAAVVENSTNSASAGYCAAEQGKFWEWYGWILKKLNNDYFSKGIGDSATATEHIPQLDVEYFTKVGDKIDGLDEDKLLSCTKSDEAHAAIGKNTDRAAKIVQGGLPYYVFNTYVSPGFDGNWEVEHDWKSAKMLFDAGIASKKK
ncbi:thioredoxin domain-containing protein [Candidatus Saccharibacteria bacterium]|nr:thioredoxin domain-containing protein [Candidatus Saccharibacteria bacterium]